MLFVEESACHALEKVMSLLEISTGTDHLLPGTLWPLL